MQWAIGPCALKIYIGVSGVMVSQHNLTEIIYYLWKTSCTICQPSTPMPYIQRQTTYTILFWENLFWVLTPHHECSMFYQLEQIENFLIDCNCSVGSIINGLNLIHFWNIDEIYGDGLLNPSQAGDYQLSSIYIVCMPHIPPVFEANSNIVETFQDGMSKPSEVGDKQLEQIYHCIYHTIWHMPGRISVAVYK